MISIRSQCTAADVRVGVLWAAVLALLGAVGSCVAAEEPAKETTASASPDPRFQLNELRVLGNTVLDTRTVESAVYRFLGPDKTLKDVEAAQKALEAVYHERGYGTVFVDIPEQTIEADGVVRLRVAEGKLRKVTISGAHYFSGRQIRNAVPAAAEGSVPNLPALQAQVNAANAVEQQDRIVVPVLKAGPIPGTIDLDLKVQEKLPLHGSLEVNNQYTPDTSPLRVMASVSYDNLFRRFDSVSLQYQVSPQDRSQVSVIAAGYVARLDDAGDKLSVTFIDSSSAVATIGTLGVTGKGQIYSTRYIMPLAASSASISQFMFGFDYKDFAQDVVVSQTSSLATPIKYASLSGTYNLSVFRPSRVWSWSTGLTIGVPGIGSSRADFANKCFGCAPNFAVLHMDGSLRQNLFAGFSAVVQLAGQYSVDPVISNEQFQLGGAHSIRGYLEAEDLGDIGARGSAELHAPNLLPKMLPLSALPFVFYDAGRISYQLPLSGQPRSSLLRSWGVGIDLGAWNFLSGSIDWARPLVDGSRTRRGDGRWEFVVRSTW